jgi:hypothetical protein
MTYRDPWCVHCASKDNLQELLESDWSSRVTVYRAVQSRSDRDLTITMIKPQVVILQQSLTHIPTLLTSTLKIEAAGF